MRAFPLLLVLLLALCVPGAARAQDDDVPPGTPFCVRPQRWELRARGGSGVSGVVAVCRYIGPGVPRPTTRVDITVRGNVASSRMSTAIHRGAAGDFRRQPLFALRDTVQVQYPDPLLFIRECKSEGNLIRDWPARLTGRPHTVVVRESVDTASRVLAVAQLDPDTARRGLPPDRPEYGTHTCDFTIVPSALPRTGGGGSA